MPPAPSPRPVLEVSGLHFAHPGAAALFDGLGFSLPPGLTRLDAESGKTTLLRLLAGDLRGAGRYRLDGREWDPATEPGAVAWFDPRDERSAALTPDACRDAARARHVGFDLEAWPHHLQAFGLDEHRHKTLHMLSTGSRRKVALALALSAGAALTLLDEPTAGLDKPSIEVLAEALSAQAAAQPRRAWLLSAAWGLEDRLPWAAALDF